MNIFNYVSLLGGLAFFLYGMHVLSSSLERTAGGRLERTIQRMTTNQFVGLVLGAGITIAIQSSSALTVMLVGMVNSGIMHAADTFSLIMGGNIGTTLTAWITSLAGLQSDSAFLQMLKPENFSLLFAFAGSMMLMFSKKQKQKDLGEVLIGFAVLMFGMKIMSDAMKPLQEIPEFSQFLRFFRNPIVGVLVGTIFTGLIQSSAASVAILQALSLTGALTWGMALPIVMGQNIGTCMTALLASIGVNRQAKRVPALHVMIKVMGTVIFLVIVYGLDAIFKFSIMDTAINPVGIAISHTIFNVLTTMILMPFKKQIMWLVYKIVPAKESLPVFTPLDEHLLQVPPVAVSEAMNLTRRMADVAQDCLQSSLTLLDGYDEEVAQHVVETEDALDQMEDQLGSFMVKLSSQNLSQSDGLKASLILHAIGDFERIGDHAVNMLHSFQEINEKDLDFSTDGLNEIEVLRSAILDIVNMSVSSFKDWDTITASYIEPLEQVVDTLTDTIKSRHIQRLQEGKCSIEMGFVLSDLLGNFERISDHCSNIGIAIIELKHSSFETHEHLNHIKTIGDEGFREAYELYAKKYQV